MGYAMHHREPTVILCRITMPRGSLSERDTVQQFYDNVNPPSDVSSDSASEPDNDVMEAAGNGAMLAHLSELAAEVPFGEDNPADAVMDDGSDVDDDNIPDDYLRSAVDEEDANDGNADAADATDSANLQLAQYFERPDVAEDFMYTNFHAHYVIHKNNRRVDRDSATDFKGRIWSRQKRVVLARMPWLSPFHGEIFYLRVLLNAYTARTFDELRGNYSSFAARH